MEKKFTSHILLIGVILVHLLLVIATPSTYDNSLDGTEINILYNIATDGILILFMLLLVFKSTKMVFLYCALYETATFAGLLPLGETQNYTIFYGVLSALIYCGVVAIAKQLLKKEMGKLTLKIILLMTILGAVSNSYISPGFGAPESNFNFQIAALFIMALFTWVMAKLANSPISLRDAGAALLLMVVLPLLKRLALFLVLGLLGIDVTEFSERIILIYGVDLIVSVVIAYLLVAQILESMPDPFGSPAPSYSLNGMPSLSVAVNKAQDATTLKILKQVQALQSPNMQQRNAAVLAISQIDDPRVTQILQDVYETSPDMVSRILAMKALEERNIMVSGSPISENAENSDANKSEELEKYVRQLLELRKGNFSTSFFLGANQPVNLMGMGEEIAGKFGTQGLEYVTQKIRSELKATHPYDGRELESAWEDIWTAQKMKEG